VTGVNLTEILRIFYSTGAAALPVVTEDSASEFRLIGFITRKDLDREFSDIKRTNNNYNIIPEHLIRQIGEISHFHEFFKQSNIIPILTQNGELQPGWTERELLLALSSMGTVSEKKETDTININEPESDKSEHNSSSPDSWLAKLLLSGISHPLFASGLRGETLFYNQSFEKEILNHVFFNNSISNLELYFLELTRDILARHAMKGLSTEKLTAASSQIPYIMDITTLEENKKVLGYLYIFRNSDQVIEEISALAVESKQYKFILDGVESRIIIKTLENNQYNISHTSDDLNIKRSTLQNRIKLLDLEETIQSKRNMLKNKINPGRKISEEKISEQKTRKNAKKDISGSKSKKKTDAKRAERTSPKSDAGQKISVKKGRIKKK